MISSLISKVFKCWCSSHTILKNVFFYFCIDLYEKLEMITQKTIKEKLLNITERKFVIISTFVIYHLVFVYKMSENGENWWSVFPKVQHDVIKKQTNQNIFTFKKLESKLGQSVAVITCVLALNQRYKQHWLDIVLVFLSMVNVATMVYWHLKWNDSNWGVKSFPSSDFQLLS